jgi:ApeA N-terminal domain 1
MSLADPIVAESRHVGTWWLPTRPNRRIPGTLAISRDGRSQLELDGALAASSYELETNKARSRDYDIVLGRVGHEPWTLYDCLTVSWESTGERLTRQVLSVGTAFEGLRASRPDDLDFDTAALGLDLLGPWASWSEGSGRIIPQLSRGPDPARRAGVEYRPGSVLKAATNEWTIELREHLRSSNRPARSELEIAYAFHVDLTQPLHFEQWHTRYLRPLQNFVSLATNQGARITNLTLAHSERRTGPRGRRYPIRVKMHSGFIRQVEASRQRALTRSRCLLQLDDIATRFQGIMTKWMRASHVFKDACELFFAPRYAESMYLEPRFLMMAQSLEVFHRSKYPDATIFPPEEYESVRKELVRATDKRYRDVIAIRLNRGNDPFLTHRLQKLAEDAGPGFTNLVDPVKAWADRLKDTRNDLTHWSQERRGVERGTKAFFRLLHEVDFLMSTVLLRELGFSQEECAELLAKNQLYRDMPWLYRDE